MAINPQFLGVSGFSGVSCKGSSANQKASLSFNVDTSSGTIRPREGFETIRRFYPSVASGSPSKALAVRVLGVKSFESQNGDSLILVVMWDPNAAAATSVMGQTLFSVIDSTGSLVDNSMPLSLNSFPNSVLPDPYGFPTFAEFGNDVYMAFPCGQVLVYSFDKDPLRVFGIEGSPNASESSVVSFLESAPAASIVHSFGPYMIYAGFNGEDISAFSTPMTENQNLVPEENLVNNRGADRPPKTAIYYSEAGTPTTVPSDFFGVVGGTKKINGLTSLGSTLYAFTEEAVYSCTFRGFGSEFFLVSDRVGLASPRSIVVGGGVVTFLSHHGVYAITGGSLSKISDDIDDMFSEDGWSLAPMYGMAKALMEDVPLPFKVLQSQLKFSCGAFDSARNLFWWSLPVAGTHYDEVYGSAAQGGSLTEVVARVCVVWSPITNEWSIWGATGSSSFVPTCFDSYNDGTKQMFIFGDEFSGVNSFGDSMEDRLSSSVGRSTTVVDAGVSFSWFWQSQPLDLGQNVACSARTIRVRQRATGGNYTSSEKTKWHLETERSFDQPDGELSFTGDMATNPTEQYPQKKTPDHIWGQGTWGAFKWHANSKWRARYSVNNDIVGQLFYVGFDGTAKPSRSQREEIFDLSLEVQPKRDIT